MSNFSKLILSAAALGVLSACNAAITEGTDGVEITAPAEAMRITGEVAYRERIALTPGHVMHVTLSDVSRADAKAPVMAETRRTLTTEQVPLGFELAVPSGTLQSNHRYAVRVTLHDALGNLAWTTDSVHQIDNTALEQDLGVMRLVSAGGTQ